MTGIRLAAAVTALFAACSTLHSQTVPEGYELVDSLIFTPVNVVDSTLNGKTIWSALPYNVRVYDSAELRRALDERTAGNSSARFNGYRVRIFFDNSQTARSDSEAALHRFKARNPGVSAYRTFANPYFKVTVGDYRTKSEARAALEKFKWDFPTAFIVRERFRYPAIENENAFRVDTIRFLRPVATEVLPEQQL